MEKENNEIDNIEKPEEVEGGDNEKYTKIYIALFAVLAGAISAVFELFSSNCCICCKCNANDILNLVMFCINIVLISFSFVVDIVGIINEAFKHSSTEETSASKSMIKPSIFSRKKCCMLAIVSTSIMFMLLIQTALIIFIIK